jgi:hypothetical protein
MNTILLLIIIALLAWAVALIHEVGCAINKVDLAAAKDAERILAALKKMERERRECGETFRETQ